MRKNATIGICRLVLMAGAALFPLGPAAMAQAVYGSIYGTVTDNTGAAVPKATVTVTDVAKGTTVTLTTNDSGDFTAEHLIPDVYTVKVETQGFKSFQQQNIQVFADNSVKVAAALEVGSTGETVNVDADQVPLLKTDRADVSTQFSAQQIEDLPIPDRNFSNLQLLLPGAQLLGWSHAASENPQGSKQIEVDGQAFAGVAYQLDGTDNQDPILGIIVINPNVDALSEAKIATQNFDAEFGKAVSSVVTAQTKSGTNSFHGSAFDYRQSNANLARDSFTQSTGPNGSLSATNPFPAGLRNQFGGTIGGPIKKDKIFFFGDYQGVRQKVGIANIQTVPTAHLISTCLGQSLASDGTSGCDFSEYANALRGNTAVNSNPIIFRPGTKTGYTNNVIPTAELSKPALNLLAALQPFAPNTTGSNGGLSSNYAKSGIGGFNSDEWDARGDWTASQRIHVFGRFSRFTDTLTGTTMFGAAGGAGFGLGGYGGTSKGANDSVALGTDIAVNPKLVTDVRLGYYRYNIGTHKYDEGVNYAEQLGIPGENTGSLISSGAPDINITEVNSFGGPNNGQATGPQYGAGLNVNRCNCPLTEREDQYQVVNNWTKTLGNHEVKFGADLRYARNLRVPSDQDRTGINNFGTGPTSGGVGNRGLGFATFVLGDVTNFTRYVSTSTNAKEFQKRDFFYVQDTWRATQKLTANYGVRYELYFPESINQTAGGSLLNLATGYNQVAGVGGVKSNMNIGLASGAWSPRIGLAYQATNTLVLRAGYGRSFDIGVFGSIFGHAATQNLPILASQQIQIAGGDNSTNNSATPAFALATGPSAPTFPSVPSNGLLPNPGNLVSSHARPTTERLPTIDAWNASLQQALTPTLSLNVAYVANKGTHTLGDQSGNAENPNEAGDFLPAEYSITGQTLHFDPTAGQGITSTGATANNIYLQRYYGAKLAACSDPAYTTVGGAPGTLPNGTAVPGTCGWNNGITYYANDLDTHYNALQASLTKQMAHGVSLTANYAWQQAISESTGYSTWSHRAVRGRDGALRQQQIIVYGVFQLPFGKGKALLNHSNSIINQAISGIEINPVVTYSSGLPFTLSYPGCGSNVGSAPCYPNGDMRTFHKQVKGFPANGLTWYPAFADPNSTTANGNTVSPGDPLLAAGEGTFTVPLVDQIGNTGRNNAFGPNFFNTDLSISKSFTIAERVNFQLRADGYNAFNHINWGTPNGNLTSGGTITSGPYPSGTTGATRQLQFSGRLQF